MFVKFKIYYLINRYMYAYQRKSPKVWEVWWRDLPPRKRRTENQIASAKTQGIDP